MSIFSPPDPTAYAWQRHASGSYRRLSLSSESMWVSKPREARHIFILAELTTTQPANADTIFDAAKKAWRKLRFEVPELQLSSVFENENAYLQYECPESQKVDTWVKQTTYLESSTEAPDFKRLRDLFLYRSRDNFCPASLLIYSQYENRQILDVSKKFWCMLNTDHLITDGIGTRVLLGKYLEEFSKSLAAPNSVEDTKLLWGETWKNLSPPWITIMNNKQEYSGRGFKERVSANQEYLFHTQSPDPGIPLCLPSTHSTQEIYFLTLSREQTTVLLKAVKSLPTTNPTNITSLTHAAMLVAMLRLNPTQQQHFYSACWLNGRRYLKSCTGRDMTKEFIPVCMSFAPIIFEDLTSLTVDKEASKEETGTALLKAVDQANSEYKKLREKESILNEFVSIANQIGRSIRSNPPNLQAPIPKTAAPLFLSDGLTDQYISHTYPKDSSSPALVVDDIHFAANAADEVIIRLARFRGCTRLSAEWKSDLFDGDMVREFLGDVRRVMFSIVGEGDV
ncbi:hypothetical protein GLAREA_01552 [Glarea lozoyensis ATCC 20868]|uniref:CoA-dependent acyltransferase n=1 Tax=Glarea lozoyensis (strain ATCC 20868 / MF5171) TaxID=1116229 RepID=S3CIH8_GLAL2|nr:uncharacterized protein GLAREA_01552 [Glarea lozoyensis ATCC 20868]EPE25640.1 hypothetical protein GLAREA_01552 [Glarea lozoyensis ATCC 20868]